MNPSYELMDRAREEYARKGVLRQEFNRGYEAGKRARTPEQWQLDMERMEVARRVDAVTMDKGSHENLSAIAAAIYEPKFGWTSGACAMLRDRLVRLLGGAHERDSRDGRDDTCAPRADNSDGEQAEEVMQSELVNCGNPYKAGGAVLDSGVIAQYDMLGNERHKAIAKLRTILNQMTVDTINGPYYEFYEKLASAIGIETNKGLMFSIVRDRLIHLLGGNQPSGIDVLRAMDTESDTDGTCPNDVTTSSITDERHKAVCRLRKICAELGASVWTWIEDVAIAIGAQDGPNDEYESMLPKITCRLIHLLGGDEPNLTESAKTIKFMENDENHKIATITDELREWIERQDNKIKEDQCWILPPYDERELLAELAAIADRIDARHHLTSIVAEASTSDEWTTMSEYDKVRRQRDELRAELEELRRQSRACPKSDEEVSESAPPATITNELRVWAHGLSDPWKLSVEAPLLAIADRIDEQFRRICEQHEAVLQSTIDDMCDELDGLMANNSELMANNSELAAKCGELQERVLQSTIEQMADENLTVKDERDYLRKQRDELQAKLDKIMGVLDVGD